MPRLSAFLLCAAFCSLSLSPAQAGAQTLTGLVVDQSSRNPMALVRVTLWAPDSVPVVSALSNLSGYFAVTVPEAGTYRVSAEAGFYRTYADGHVSLTAGDTSSVGITLVQQAVEVEGLVVEARRRARRGARSRARSTPAFRRLG